jgi:hypothetical protein
MLQHKVRRRLRERIFLVATSWEPQKLKPEDKGIWEGRYNRFLDVEAVLEENNDWVTRYYSGSNEFSYCWGDIRVIIPGADDILVGRQLGDIRDRVSNCSVESQSSFYAYVSRKG